MEAKASSSTKEERHCVRCHASFVLGDNSACIVEHDTDLFEGSRNGTAWYTGTLGCCGADYRFHRHSSDDKAEPAHCFEGTHTTHPDEVEYNKTTIKHCDKDGCGEDLHKISKAAYDGQMKSKKRAREAQKAKRDAEKTSKRARIDELRSQGKRREARLLRAELLGMEVDEEDMNSDIDPDGCEEFDYASDSSLVPPWAADD
mmetsp:Transcript_21008/g.44983  ORF Transcript_21008/g.44983 Transcript_21008/m.44983 type:complete len:202 (+) Transcript_21008:54-659(+)